MGLVETVIGTLFAVTVGPFSVYVGGGLVG